MPLPGNNIPEAEDSKKGNVMKRLTLIIAAILASAAAATAEDSRIAKFCGTGHVNELASANDASGNPAGYYVASLKVQLRRGDPRVIATNGDTFHLCTRTAATPDMDAARAILLMQERTVKYLFVPVEPRRIPHVTDVSG